MLNLAKRLDAIEPLVKARSGNLEPSVYGVIDRVDKIDGKLVSIVNETYMGISLVGPREIVEPIADRVRVEWGCRTRS